MRRQHLHKEQLSAAAEGTASGRRLKSLFCRRSVRSGVDGIGSSSRRAQQRAGVLELLPIGGTPDTVIPDLGTAARQHMQQEAVNELLGREGNAV